jgi:hypothetical protein
MHGTVNLNSIVDHVLFLNFKHFGRKMPQINTNLHALYKLNTFDVLLTVYHYV